LAALAFLPSVKADDWNKKTVVTFSKPVEIPGGVVLPAGAVVWTLLKTRAAPKRRPRVLAGKCVAKSLPARTRARRLSVKTKVS
jgi:hypothetical protein